MTRRRTVQADVVPRHPSGEQAGVHRRPAQGPASLLATRRSSVRRCRRPIRRLRRGRNARSVRRSLELVSGSTRRVRRKVVPAGASRDQFDVAAMRHHQIARNRQAEPGAAPPDAAGKRAEQIGAHRLRQAGPVIGDLEREQRSSLPRRDAHAMRPGLGRVAQQDDQNAEQLDPIGPAPGCAGSTALSNRRALPGDAPSPPPRRTSGASATGASSSGGGPSRA